MRFEFPFFNNKHAWLCLFALICFMDVTVAGPFRIAELEFKGSRVIDIIRVLAEDAGVNIIATPDAGKKEVTIFLKNISLEEAIKSICQISNLWYRRDQDGKGMFRLMTAEEYANDLVVGQDHSIKVFQLHTPNVFAIASAIENLYGDRVEVSLDESSRNGGSNNNSGSGRSGGSNRSGGRNDRNNRSSTRRGGNSANNVQAELLPDSLTVAQLKAIAAANKQVDVKQLAKVAGVKKIIYVTVNSEHNLLIVKTSDQGILKSIATLVKRLDIPQTQVMLEMKIIDIKVGEDFSSLFKIDLIDTPVTGNSLAPITLGSAAFTGGGTLMYEFLSKNIKAQVELLEKNNRLKIVSNPMIVASNHRAAKLFVGEERVMVTGYSIDTIDTLNNARTIVAPETKTEEIGTTLEVTPHINSDGSVHIILKQENSTLNEKAASIPIVNNGVALNLPIDTITTAKLNGEVFAKHGYTVAVGGLIRDSFSRARSKVPFLADIPVIGEIFRSTVDSDSQSEMVLLITPYILNQNQQKSQFDPTDKFYKHAQGAEVVHSKKLPVKTKKQLVCGEFCSPANLKKTDL